MNGLKVNHYYKFSYANPEYVAIMVCHILDISDTSIIIEGFTVSKNGAFHKFSDGRAAIVNRYRVTKEITEDEYHAEFILEQL